MVERRSKSRQTSKPKTEIAKKTEIAVIERSQLDRDFERIIAEMHQGFDRVQEETMAGLAEIDSATDFEAMRVELDMQFDIIEQAGEAELARLREQGKASGEDGGVLQASVEFAKAQDELVATAEELASATYGVRVLAYEATVKAAAVAAVSE